jgi:hypothetical protein
MQNNQNLLTWFEVVRGTKDVIKLNTTNHYCTSRCAPSLVNASNINVPPMKAQVALVTELKCCFDYKILMAKKMVY